MSETRAANGERVNRHGWPLDVLVQWMCEAGDCHTPEWPQTVRGYLRDVGEGSGCEWLGDLTHDDAEIERIRIALTEAGWSDLEMGCVLAGYAAGYARGARR